VAAKKREGFSCRALSAVSFQHIASGIVFVDEEFIRQLSRGFATITND
jgi:hypothetical protein